MEESYAGAMKADTARAKKALILAVAGCALQMLILASGQE
jgi:hypothetical protein